MCFVMFQPEPLFKKIDAAQIQQLKSMFSGQQSKVFYCPFTVYNNTYNNNNELVVHAHCLRFIMS